MQIKIFVSYSHQDAGYLEKDSLLGYLLGLEEEGADFWWDAKGLVGGDDWDAEIKTRISDTHIALVLVSQMFLDSRYCKDVEISGLLLRRRESGLIIFPVILSACEWERHDWLKGTQFLPPGSKTIEEHYTEPGNRKRLFYKIRQDLRTQILRAREIDLQTSQQPSTTSKSQRPDSQLQPDQSAAVESLGEEKSLGPADRELLSELVERLLLTEVPETGGFDGSVFEPSGAPSLWSTAQCLTGLLNVRTLSKEGRDTARSSLDYVLTIQRDDGGWAYSDTMSETVTEVSCWVALACAKSFEFDFWKSQNDERERSAKAVERAVKHILDRKSANGGWCPTDQVVPHNTRTYSTAMAAWSLHTIKNAPSLDLANRLDGEITAAIKWLLDTRRDDLGWVPNPNRRHQKDRHPGLNAQVLFILTQLERDFHFLKKVPVYRNAKRDFLTNGVWWKYDFFENTSIRDADQWLEGTDFRVEGSTFGWCPWSLAALKSLSVDSELSEEHRKRAVELSAEVMGKVEKCSDEIGTSGTWELAETLFGIAYALR